MANQGKHPTAPSAEDPNVVGHTISNIWHCPGRKPTWKGRVPLPVGRSLMLSGWKHNSVTTGAPTALGSGQPVAQLVDQSKQAASLLQDQARAARDLPETESTLRWEQLLTQLPDQARIQPPDVLLGPHPIVYLSTLLQEEGVIRRNTAQHKD